MKQTSYKKLIYFLFIALSLVLFAACEKPKESQDHSHDQQQPGKTQDYTSSKDPKAGHELNPKISVSDVPAGAWYCSMGDVEYYRYEKGDGKCPICGMPLKHKDEEK